MWDWWCRDAVACLVQLGKMEDMGRRAGRRKLWLAGDWQGQGLLGDLLLDLEDLLNLPGLLWDLLRDLLRDLLQDLKWWCGGQAMLMLANLNALVRGLADVWKAGRLRVDGEVEWDLRTSEVHTQRH